MAQETSAGKSAVGIENALSERKTDLAFLFGC
jgi:hypothetical protein